MNSIKYFKDKDVTFVTPLELVLTLRVGGIDSKKIIEKD